MCEGRRRSGVRQMVSIGSDLSRLSRRRRPCRRSTRRSQTRQSTAERDEKRKKFTIGLYGCLTHFVQTSAALATLPPDARNNTHPQRFSLFTAQPRCPESKLDANFAPPADAPRYTPPIPLVSEVLLDDNDKGAKHVCPPLETQSCIIRSTSALLLVEAHKAEKLRPRSGVCLEAAVDAAR